ncbi:MAG: tRNA(Ile2) 2-agmatinylcytidine synthetase, partial [Candidatus Thorarchaeota archaeon]
MRVHLGIDSTDSATKGMCTTYVGMVLVKRLLSRGVQFIDYPHLIRLNPNIPYKTRGNGAVALRFHTDAVPFSHVAELAKKTVEELSVFSDPQTNPGIALFKGNLPAALHAFYQRALHRLLTVEDAITTANDTGAILHGYKN